MMANGNGKKSGAQLDREINDILVARQKREARGRAWRSRDRPAFRARWSTSAASYGRPNSVSPKSEGSAGGAQGGRGGVPGSDA